MPGSVIISTRAVDVIIQAVSAPLILSIDTILGLVSSNGGVGPTDAGATIVGVAVVAVDKVSFTGRVADSFASGKTFKSLGRTTVCAQAPKLEHKSPIKIHFCPNTCMLRPFFEML
jgi:hypothetical protein